MFCPKCGNKHEDPVLKCTKCGENLENYSKSGETKALKISNYLVQAILCTVCCCPALGIPGIVYAAQVNSKVEAGDIYGALDSSKKAKMWCWIALGCGLVINIVGAILSFLSAVVASSV